MFKALAQFILVTVIFTLAYFVAYYLVFSIVRFNLWIAHKLINRVFYGTWGNVESWTTAEGKMFVVKGHLS